MLLLLLSPTPVFLGMRPCQQWMVKVKLHIKKKKKKKKEERKKKGEKKGGGGGGGVTQTQHDLPALREQGSQ